MDLLDQFKLAEIITGLIIAMFAVGAGIVYWFQRQMRNASGEAFRRVDDNQQVSNERLSRIERDVSEFSEDLERVGARMQDMERRLERVASADDLAKLRSEVSGFAGSFREVRGMIDTLYKAALQASMGDAR